ncbi:glycosyltransferase [Vibrio mediterranei]|uniref:Glycosyl transferase family 1 n=1 Tax=Vibrio mediterranei TaxID=689 RepID=A0ABX5DCX9_9VIBR|nr:glycosyltransferase [Vibrio mediterranei]PCD87711.1 glycosyl transferase family 1 [Vibrio mediterranei]PRQ67335.1 glycosyl transferase family 1 [Vibrio mediterranei]
MKILINASNIHTGGGVQVASSFISELREILKNDTQYSVSVIVSSQVERNLPKLLNKEVFADFTVLDIFGLSLFNLGHIQSFSGFDVVFTVFGPFYLPLRTKKHICGFAQPWIAYPKNDVYPKMNFPTKLQYKAKYLLQSLFFRTYDLLVVEQEHVKIALVDQGYNKDNIRVVSNCVSSVYDTPSEWARIEELPEPNSKSLTLGFIGRAYLHKNVSILKDVQSLLCDKYNIHVSFLLTLKSCEMRQHGLEGVPGFYSVGAITVEQCPSFYNAIDALVFPSLLECFSASPIEAMKMSTPVFASNYPFITEVCRENAYYFDPLDADSIAKSIYGAYIHSEGMISKRNNALEMVNKMPTARDRALEFFSLITS